MGVLIGFFLARFGIRMDRKVQNEKSKEMYYKQYIIYKDQFDLLLRYMELFVYENKRDEINLIRINRMCDYLKNEFLAFPLDTIPKEIFLQHRELMRLLVNFQLDTRMEMEFKDAIIVGYEEKQIEYEVNYSMLCNQILEVEKFLT